MNVTTGNTSFVKGTLTAVPVALEEMVVDLDFIVVDRSQLDVIIGDTAMEDLKGIIDIGNRTI